MIENFLTESQMLMLGSAKDLHRWSFYQIATQLK